MGVESFRIRHRGKDVRAYNQDPGWRFKSINVYVAEFDGAFWIIPAYTTDDNKMADEGPFPCLEVAVVAATLS